jgi:hypothetical protein
MNQIQFPIAPTGDGTGLFAQFPHGLGHPPAFIRAVWVCTNADPSPNPEEFFAVGDEVDAAFIFHTLSTCQGTGVTADSTNIYCSVLNDEADYFVVQNKFDTGNSSLDSQTNWSLKIYWQ